MSLRFQIRVKKKVRNLLRASVLLKVKDLSGLQKFAHFYARKFILIFLSFELIDMN